MDLAKRLLSPLASLKLTVALFVAAMFLIFAGTLAQARQGTWTIIESYFRSPIAWIDLQVFVPERLAEVPGTVPFPGGVTLIMLLLVNLVAAHTARFKYSFKRVGIVVTHAGLILLLLGEVGTGLLAEEGQMPIEEGASANYVQDIRTAELYVVDPSHPEQDRVTVIPEAMLSAGGTIRHEDLPFDVTVERWLPNAALVGPMQATPAERQANPATDGAGEQIVARQVPEVTGAQQEVDMPSTYVTLSRGGETLGTWMVSAQLPRPQGVQVGDKTYEIGLRFERTYKPYTIHLIDFQHEKYTGTETPSDFASVVRLVDPAQNEDRRVRIYMNHPLHYAGETFYQSAFMPGDRGTVLQVVRNPVWILPYVSSGMIAGGMLIHFAVHLWRFTKRAIA